MDLKPAPFSSLLIYEVDRTSRVVPLPSPNLLPELSIPAEMTKKIKIPPIVDLGERFFPSFPCTPTKPVAPPLPPLVTHTPVRCPVIDMFECSSLSLRLVFLKLRRNACLFHMRPSSPVVETGPLDSHKFISHRLKLPSTFRIWSRRTFFREEES